MRPKTSSEMKLAELIGEKCSFDKSDDAITCVKFIHGVYIQLYNRLTRTADVTPTEHAIRHFMQTGFKAYTEAILEGDIKESDSSILIKTADVPINICGDILVRMFKMGQLSDEEWRSVYSDIKDAGSIIIDRLLH